LVFYFLRLAGRVWYIIILRLIFAVFRLAVFALSQQQFTVQKSFKYFLFIFSNLQVEATFKKFDQTGNDKLNYREFCDMMNKKTERAASRPRLSTVDSQTKPPPSGGAEVTSPKKEL
jgi:hypothetical protein